MRNKKIFVQVFLLLLMLIFMLLLTACMPEKTEPLPKAGENEFLLNSLPKLDAFEPYSNLGELHGSEMLNALVPSDDYGMIYPYVGKQLVAEDYWAVNTYFGLADSEGRIITAPVYTSFTVREFDGGSLVTLYLPSSEIGTKKEELLMSDSNQLVVAARDGSWVTEPLYGYLADADAQAFIVCLYGVDWIEDYQSNLCNILLYDTKSGKLLLDLKEVVYLGYSGGQLAVGRKDKDGVWRAALLDKEGNTLFSNDYSILSPFRDGISAARDRESGLWGLLSENGSWLIAPQYEQIVYNSDAGCYEYYNYTQKMDRGVISAEGKTLYTQSGQGNFILIKDAVNGHVILTSDNGTDSWLLIDLTEDITVGPLSQSQYTWLNYCEDGWYYVIYQEKGAQIVELRNLKQPELKLAMPGTQIDDLSSEHGRALIGSYYYDDESGFDSIQCCLFDLDTGKKLKTFNGYYGQDYGDYFSIQESGGVLRYTIYDWDGGQISQQQYEGYNRFENGWACVWGPIYGGLIDENGEWLIRRVINTDD